MAAWAYNRLGDVDERLGIVKVCVEIIRLPFDSA